ncbi:MAG: hypothetical protein NZ740_06340 [Kiritimatiellae bacterium]|nr:hypothetical protein [Kiritimatiellia bacterium]MDW8458714.1 hypothetical protein [Verrucomicrobiota bacterium]
MKRDRLERWILLRQAGELDGFRAKLLDWILAKDPELQQFARIADRLTREASGVPDEYLPTSVAADVVRGKGHSAPDHPPKSQPIFSIESIRAAWPFAVATAMLLFGGLYLFILLRPPENLQIQQAARSDAIDAPSDHQLVGLDWDDGLDAELGELMTSISSVETEEKESAPAQEETEESLIRRWLELEGIAI